MGRDSESALTRTLRSFDRDYQGTPPWEIGRPQVEIVRLVEQGAIQGRVLDVGCGTGENSLYLAERGLEVWGVDGAPRAIEQARAKAAARELPVQFVLGSAFELERLLPPLVWGKVEVSQQEHAQFDTAIDAGMFHCFSDEERPLFARSLACVIRPGGVFYLLCWSELEPGTSGPRRITQAEIQSTFAEGWAVRSIREAFWEENVPAGGFRSWLATIERQT